MITFDDLPGDSPFNPKSPKPYKEWREKKLKSLPQSFKDLIVFIKDPYNLKESEIIQLVEKCNQHNLVFYRCQTITKDPQVLRAIGIQIGLTRLHANWLAEPDGLSLIRVASKDSSSPRSDFIPYTQESLNWHTDGYYHDVNQAIHGMSLHCLQHATTGGTNGFADPEILYLLTRDASSTWVESLMRADTLTIPSRGTSDEMHRPARSGPVFYLRQDGGLQMRYTMRTRSIQWRSDRSVQEAENFIRKTLNAKQSWIYQVKLTPGMGVISNNVLHCREKFVDDPSNPRIVVRARYLDHIPRTVSEIDPLPEKSFGS